MARQNSPALAEGTGIPKPVAPSPLADDKSSKDKPNQVAKTAHPALVRAVSLHLDGQLTAALDHLREALRSGSREPGIHAAMGHILCELRNFAEASEQYSKLLELEPEHRSAHFNKAVCLARLERWSEASTSFERSLRIDPARREANLGLGTCLLHLERSNDAFKAFSHYLGANPTHEEASLRQAQVARCNRWVGCGRRRKSINRFCGSVRRPKSR